MAEINQRIIMSEAEKKIAKRDPVIVCAACMFEHCRAGQIIIVGVRHWDVTMDKTYLAMKSDKMWNEYSKAPDTGDYIQGFVDQYGKFYTREEAMLIVKESGQKFDPERNGNPSDELFSEGLY